MSDQQSEARGDDAICCVFPTRIASEPKGDEDAGHADESPGGEWSAEINRR